MATLDELLVLLASSSAAWKHAVRVVATANITLSGLQTIDSVALAEGDRVLVTGQTSGVQNGIYEASAGTWARAEDMRLSRHVQLGTTVLVLGGTVYALTTWVLTSPSTGTVRLGSDSLTFTRSGNAVLVGGNAIISSASGGYVGLQEGTTEVLRVNDEATVSTISGRGAGGTTLVSNTGALSLQAGGGNLELQCATGSRTVIKEGSGLTVCEAYDDGGTRKLEFAAGTIIDNTSSFIAMRCSGGFVAIEGNDAYLNAGVIHFRSEAGTLRAQIVNTGTFVLPVIAAASVSSPSAGSYALFFDSSNSDKLSKKDSAGTVTVIGTEA